MRLPFLILTICMLLTPLRAAEPPARNTQTPTVEAPVQLTETESLRLQLALSLLQNKSTELAKVQAEASIAQQQVKDIAAAIEQAHPGYVLQASKDGQFQLVHRPAPEQTVKKEKK